MSLFRILFLAAVFIVPSAWPQAQSTSGDLTGTVLDQAGAAVADAKIIISDAARGILRATTTNSGGEYHVPLLPPGGYRVRVEAAGFAARVVEGVEVRVGDTVVLPVRLEVGALSQELTIVAETPTVDVERQQQANTIEFARIRDLPINRRSYLDFALLAPGTADTGELVDGTDLRVAQTVQSGLSFGGGNGRGNGFFIDGVENFINSGGFRLSVSQEAVQEFQINRNSTSAEFGWASGGTVNIITRSGSNEFHGNLFGFLRHKAIQARNFFDPDKSSFTRSQAGTTLGGRLVKDRSFFFLAYERLDRQETVFVPILQDRGAFTTLPQSQQQLFSALESSGIPQFAGLARQAAYALTPANSPQVESLFSRNSGTFPFGEQTQTFSTRLDHRFSDRHFAFLRAGAAWADQDNSQFGALVALSRGRGFRQFDGTVMANDNMVLSPRWLVDTRLMFNYNTLFVEPSDPHGPEINITGFGFFGRDIFLPFRNFERHYQVLQNWSHTGNRHHVKFGFDLNPVRDHVTAETFFGGRFSFGEAVPLGNVLASAAGDPTVPAKITGYLQQSGQAALASALSRPINALQAYTLGLPTFYQQGFGIPDWVGWAKRFGMYAQDTFRAANGLTLTFGLRYEVEGNPAVVGMDNNNVAPRFGIAWSPGGASGMVVRGGYGLYYAPTNIQVPNVADTLSGRLINQVFVPLTGIASIVNPSTGRPTTSSDIYRGLLQRGVIGARTITPADLLPYGVRVGPGLPLRVEFGSDRLRQAYAQQASFEIERAIGGTAFSVGWNMSRALGIPRITGRNLYYTGQVTPAGIPVYGRFDPTLLQKNIFTYDGNSLYHAAIVQVQRRLRDGFTLSGHYTFSKALDDVTDFNSDFSPMDQLNKRAEWALSSFHHAHRVVVNAMYKTPSGGAALLRDWMFAPIFVAHSWRPFNVVAGADVNNDGYVTNDRPFPQGRNAGRGPGYWSADLRVSRRFALTGDGRFSVEVLAEGFNLSNHTNFKNVNNTVGPVPASALPARIEGIRGLPPTAPLAYTSANDPRQFQFGVKIYY